MLVAFYGSTQEFLSTPSARRATALRLCLCPGWRYFYPRPPRGGRRSTMPLRFVPCNFYPRPPRGGRPLPPAVRFPCQRQFLSTPSARRATPRRQSTASSTTGFLSTPSARRATRRMTITTSYENFYPRPPRGGRPSVNLLLKHLFAISIHALREEGDRHCTTATARRRRFLSTPSARRATRWRPRFREGGRNFYPRPPRGGRRLREVRLYG